MLVGGRHGLGHSFLTPLIWDIGRRFFSSLHAADTTSTSCCFSATHAYSRAIWIWAALFRLKRIVIFFIYFERISVSRMVQLVLTHLLLIILIVLYACFCPAMTVQLKKKCLCIIFIWCCRPYISAKSSVQMINSLTQKRVWNELRHLVSWAAGLGQLRKLSVEHSFKLQTIKHKHEIIVRSILLFPLRDRLIIANRTWSRSRTNVITLPMISPQTTMPQYTS